MNNKIIDHNKIKGFEVGMLVSRDTDHKTISKNKPYRIRGVFKYINTYGTGENKYKAIDTFITIKNDYGYTVKVNATLFKKYEIPFESVEDRLKFLEKQYLSSIK